MKKDNDEIRDAVKKLTNRLCPVCGGQDMEGDTSIHKHESSSGSYYEYVIIRCMGCNFMKFHTINSVIEPENRIINIPTDFAE